MVHFEASCVTPTRTQKVNRLIDGQLELTPTLERQSVKYQVSKVKHKRIQAVSPRILKVKKSQFWSTPNVNFENQTCDLSQEAPKVNKEYAIYS